MQAWGLQPSGQKADANSFRPFTGEWGVAEGRLPPFDGCLRMKQHMIIMRVPAARACRCLLVGRPALVWGQQCC